MKKLIFVIALLAPLQALASSQHQYSAYQQDMAKIYYAVENMIRQSDEGEIVLRLRYRKPDYSGPRYPGQPAYRLYTEQSFNFEQNYRLVRQPGYRF